MKPNWYAIIARALEEGAALGWNHAHKHVEKPSPGAIQDQIVQDQLTLLGEVVRFDERGS